MLPEPLLAILRCPKSKRELVYFPKGEANEREDAAFLFCPASRLRFRIEGGVPVLLVDEAVEVDARAADALVARAKELGLRVPA